MAKTAAQILTAHPRTPTGSEAMTGDYAGGTYGFTTQQVADLFKGTAGAALASAATVDLGAANGDFVHITGTTTITSFGTVAAGVYRKVVFDGSLTLTYHSTNLVLPGRANIVTQAGDSALFVSEGGGAWRCLFYTKVSGQGLPAVTTLTDAATVAIDASVGDNFRVVLAGNRTLGNPTNLRNGQVLNIRIKQDATGGRTLAYGSKFKFAGGSAPVLSTAANALDFLCCQYDSTDDSLVCVLNKAFG